MLALHVNVGADGNTWREINGFRLNYRQWTQIGVNINNTNREIAVFLNGERLSSFSYPVAILIPQN